MEISSSLSLLSPAASLSSISSSSSSSSFDLVHTWTPHRPPTRTTALKLRSSAVKFWFEDDGEEPVPDGAERFSCSFLEECRLCKCRMGAGRDAYICAGKEAAFCSEDCRLEWMEMEETSDDRKPRRKAMTPMKARYSSIIPPAEMYAATRYRAEGALVAV